jgi:mannose/fructose/N-acetylgalactosamine-specific phosphotransferase system component IIC
VRAHSTLSWLSVFTSSSTLVCCALPALMVALGAGAALSGLVAAVPQLVWLSEHKGPLFAVAGGMLVAAGALQWRIRRAGAECPPDPALAAACATTKDYSILIYGISVVIYAIGAFFAFAAQYFL